MRRPTFPRPRRGGFTIVELLVAAALTMFVMYILAACFAAGLESFRQVKAVGDMTERLRSAANTLRQDLTQDHFDRTTGRGGPRLSDQRMVRWNPLLPNPFNPAVPGNWEPDPAWEPPTEGFFRIFQGANNPYQSPPAPWNGVIPAYYEGMDEEGVRSTRATDHVLHFTVKRYVRKQSDLFAAAIIDPSGAVASRTRPLDYVTANQLLSQWTEVAYFLVPSNTQANNGLPLYYLVRRDKPLMPMGQPTGIPGGGSYGTISLVSTLGQSGNTTNNPLFNTSEDVTAPCRRMNNPLWTIVPTPAPWSYNPPAIAGSSGAGYVPLGTGDDIVLTDVLSFEVKVAHDLAVPFFPSVSNPDTPEFPFDYLPMVPSPGVIAPRYATCQSVSPVPIGSGLTGYRIFDTWSKAVGPSVPVPPPPGVPPPAFAPAYDYSSWRSPAAITSVPFYTRVRALQLRLRVWDAKTQQVRQVTLVQDM